MISNNSTCTAHNLPLQCHGTKTIHTQYITFVLTIVMMTQSPLLLNLSAQFEKLHIIMCVQFLSTLMKRKCVIIKIARFQFQQVIISNVYYFISGWLRSGGGLNHTVSGVMSTVISMGLMDKHIEESVQIYQVSFVGLMFYTYYIYNIRPHSM